VRRLASLTLVFLSRAAAIGAAVPASAEAESRSAEAESCHLKKYVNFIFISWRRKRISSLRSPCGQTCNCDIFMKWPSIWIGDSKIYHGSIYTTGFYDETRCRIDVVVIPSEL
jgi:hypothetical protein